jgi:hypothetical protein
MGLSGLVFMVRQVWRVARKRNQLGCGGHAGGLEVQVFYPAEDQAFT